MDRVLQVECMAADPMAAHAALRENRATPHPAILSISASRIQETRLQWMLEA
jgi:hypothetical protein